jgi:uncharacterized protein
VKRFLLSLMLTAAATTAIAQAAQTTPPMMPESITVTGSGKSTVAPDRFTFTLGVQTIAPTVDEAVNENNKKVAAAIAALKKAGAADKDIQTSQFNIWPQQDYQEGRLPRILGYQVSNNITVRSTKIADAGRLLGIALNNGVNTSSGINFEVSNPLTGREQGLRGAVDDARAKATLIAQAAGRTLGRAIVISEGTQVAPPSMPMYARAASMEAKVSDVPVESGSQELSYTVTITYELR